MYSMGDYMTEELTKIRFIASGNFLWESDLQCTQREKGTQCERGQNVSELRFYPELYGHKVTDIYFFFIFTCISFSFTLFMAL